MVSVADETTTEAVARTQAADAKASSDDGANKSQYAKPTLTHLGLLRELTQFYMP